MKTKIEKKINVIFCFLLFSLNLNAKEVDSLSINNVALNAFSEASGISKSNLEISDHIVYKQDGVKLLSVINFKESGFIMLSNHDAVEPVLGYGLKSGFKKDDVPPGLDFLMSKYMRQILKIKMDDLKPTESIFDKWDTYKSAGFTPALKSYTLGDVLLETEWGQGDGFNDECPDDPLEPNRACLVGCGGVALAQVLHYWGCRVFPDHYVSYTPDSFQNSISINFYDQSYDWEAMDHDSPDADNKELLFHCAAALESDFRADATGSNPYTFAFALRNYFGFNSNTLIERKDYQATWTTLIRNELDAERPICYTGSNYTATDTTAHAWVIDGYRTSDSKYHCNWGWAGSQDNWFTIDDLTPDIYDYNNEETMTTGIYPKLESCTEPSDGDSPICSSNVDFTVTLPSLASVCWGKSSNLQQVSSNNTETTYIVKKVSGASGVGYVTDTIKNSQGDVFMIGRKDVWVGEPTLDVSEFIFDAGDGGSDYVCTNYTGNEFDISYFNTLCECDNYQVKITNIAETVTYDQFYTSNGTGDLDYSTMSQGYYLFHARGHNDCGWGDWFDTELEFINCSQRGMVIMPNPTTGATTLTIVSTSSKNGLKSAVASNNNFDVEWEYEVYSPAQSLKIKQTKIKGATATIHANGWTEGVYTVLVKFEDEILTGKLVVKR